MTVDLGNLSIAQLEALINSRRSKLSALYEKRDQLAKQLAAVDAEIAAAEGKGMNGRAKASAGNRLNGRRKNDPPARVQNKKSLKQVVEDILAANKKGLTISEIQEAVLTSGYVTTSVNFKNTLYQCLYHNEKTFVLDKKSKTYKLANK